MDLLDNILIWLLGGVIVTIVIILIWQRRKLGLNKPLELLTEVLIKSGSKKLVEEHIPSRFVLLTCQQNVSDVVFEKDDFAKVVVLEDDADINPANIQEVFGKPLSRLFSFPVEEVMAMHFHSPTRDGNDYLSCYFKGGKFIGFVFSWIPLIQPAGVRKLAFLRMTKAIFEKKVGPLFEEMPTIAKSRNEFLFGSSQLSLGSVTMLLFSINTFADRADILDYQTMALMAEALNNEGKHEKAITILLPDAGHPDNHNSSFFNELGIAYGKIGSSRNDTSCWEKAYKYHRRAYEIDSNEPLYMFNLGMAASWLDNRVVALDLFRKYVATGEEREHEIALNAVKKLESLQ